MDRLSAMSNKRLLGDASDWFGFGAGLVGLELVVGLVHGRKWTQAHSTLATIAAGLYLISRL
jgi:hypothetical protein